MGAITGQDIDKASDTVLPKPSGLIEILITKELITYIFFISRVGSINSMLLLKSFFLIDDSMSGFLQGYINSSEADIKMIFGLSLYVCPDMDKKESETLDKTCILGFVFCVNAFVHHVVDRSN